MIITSKAEYALLIMIDLALRPELQAVTSAAEISARQGLSPKLVPHLVSSLRSAGLVETMRGPGGGVSLSPTVDPHRVTVLQILRAVGENVVVRECAGPGRSCRRQETCPLRGTWNRVQSAVDGVLASTTLTQLAEVEENRPCYGLL